MDKTTGAVIITGSFLAVVFAAFLVTVFVEPNGEVKFKANPKTGDIEWTWLPILFTVDEDAPTEITEEQIKTIKEVKNDFISTFTEAESQNALIRILENQTEILKKLAAADPDFVPVLVTITQAIEKSKSELGEIEMQLATSEIRYFETVDGINVVVPESEKDTIFSIVERLNYPRLEFDQKVYTWTDKVYITIIDPWANKNREEIDVIGGSEHSFINIATVSGSRLDYVLEETNIDTGIFSGEIILTGFPNLDVNNDNKENDATGIISGSGPFDGKLATQMEDAIHISYIYDIGEMTSTSAQIRWNVGDVQFDKIEYQVNEIAKIFLVDPDLNVNPEIPDYAIVKVVSDTSPEGIFVRVKETNSATGFFEALIKFTLVQKSSQNLLKVSLGDEIFVKYKENTFPILGAELVDDISSKAFISELVLP